MKNVIHNKQEIAVQALRTEELLSFISNGDLEKKKKEKISKELDKRNITLNNAYRRIY
jgi:ribosomal protein L9